MSASLTSPLMASLDRAMGRDAPTLISIEGHGSISVYPSQRSYTTDIRDWDSLPLTDGSTIHVRACVWSAPPSESMPVAELQWRAAYHYACQVLRTQRPRRGLVMLLHWPDLSEVPDSLAATVVRICALLWRKPCASTLLPRISGTEQALVEPLLMVLEGLGYVEVATGFMDHSGHDAPAPADMVAAPPVAPDTPSGTVITKLWQRLLGR